MDSQAQRETQNIKLARAIQALQKTRQQLQAIEAAQHEPIAIVGMGCHYPGNTNTSEDFWQNLLDGFDGIVDLPDNRTLDMSRVDEKSVAPVETSSIESEKQDNTRYVLHGGYLEKVDEFDATFFGLSPREVTVMDPAHRILLETTWQALEHANIVPADLFNTEVGVFVGGGASGWNIQNSVQSNDLYLATGSAASAGVGRISYLFGLTGPNVSVDTACSSSLVAIHLACQSLRRGECHTALTGGVNLILDQSATEMFAEGGMLSKDARCKTFDAKADGYVRGEGCGMVVLKLLSDAQADGDNIIAVIRGTAINQDGRSSGLTAPNGPSQERVIYHALSDAGLEPEQISYVEAHGTGTPLGDPIEIGALNTVFGKRTEPLYVGSVKTNIGHLEMAAGVAGLMKLALSLQHRTIPPHLHLHTPNPYIDWASSPVQVPNRETPWSVTEEQKTRIGGVSSFGFSGTNAHVIVSEAPSVEHLDQISGNGTDYVANHIDRPLHLLTLSAKNKKSLQTYAKNYFDFLAKKPGIDLGNLCYTTHTGRSHFEYRLVITTGSVDALQKEIASFIKDDAATNIKHSKVTSDRIRKRIAFLFTGQGSQYVEMGYELYEYEPTFRAILDQCEVLYQQITGESLLEVIYPAKVQSPESRVQSLETKDATLDQTTLDLGRINDTTYTQPALFALEYALAKLWQSWGVQPDMLVGHSVGEIAAACVAGLFSLEDGLKLTAARGRLMGALPQDGEMLSLLADEARVQQAIEPYVQDVSIAAVNGPESFVISGKQEAVQAIAKKLASDGVKTRKLTVSHAFHSPLMDPILDEFRRVAENISYNHPTLPLVSNVTGRVAGNEIMTADYWVRHVRETVRFADGVTTLHEQDIEIYLEIGPKPTLLGMAGEIPTTVHEVAAERHHRPPTTDYLPSLRENQSDWQRMLSSLGELYVRGVEIDWEAFDKPYPRCKVILPTYPFQRQRYWIDDSKKKRGSDSLRPLIDRMSPLPLHGEMLFETEVSVEAIPFLRDHIVYDTVVSPAACHLSMVLSAAELAFVKNEYADQRYQLADIILPQAFVLNDDETRTTQIVFSPSEQNGVTAQSKFQLVSFDRSSTDADRPVSTHAVGTVGMTRLSTSNITTLSEIQARCTDIHQYGEGDANLDNGQAIRFGPTFRWLDEIWRPAENLNVNGVQPVEVLVKFRRPDVIENLSGYILHPGLLDACFQTAGLTILLGQVGDEQPTETYLPFTLQSLQLQHQLSNGRGDVWWCHAERVAPLKWTILLFDEAGEQIAQIDEFEMRAAPSSAIQSTRLHTEWLHTIQWTAKALPVPLPNGSTADDAIGQTPDCWLIFGSTSGISTQLAESLAVRGTPTILITWGAEFSITASNQTELFQQAIVDPRDQMMFKKLMEEVSGQHHSVGVGYLWGTDEQFFVGDAPQQSLYLCAGLLHLTQALIEATLTVRLWIVTQGCQKINGANTDRQPMMPGNEAFTAAAGMLWGLGRTIAHEQPQLHCACVDLGHVECINTSVDTEVREQVNLLRQEFQGTFSQNLQEHDLEATERQVLYHNQIRYVAKLAPWQAPPESQRMETDLLRPDAVYLITGGLGALGLQVAQQLVADGANYLVLTGRRSVTTDAQQQILSQLREAGATVEVVQGDVSDVTAVQHMIECCTQIAPLRGVVHTAGVIDDDILTEQTTARFEYVMGSKVHGTWHLHTLTKEIDLDFFVCFSSAASMVGSSGQSNYAAANGFMDTLMHQRCDMGLPGLSINWGPWGEIGLATHLQEQMKARGMSMISPQQGMNLFRYLLAEHLLTGQGVNQQRQSIAQIGVFPTQRAKKMVEESTANFDWQAYQTMSQEERSQTITDLLVKMIAGTGGFMETQISPEQSLLSMGLDSLMAVELRNQVMQTFNLTVPISLLLGDEDIGTLIAYLVEHIEEPNPTPSTVSNAQIASTATSATPMNGNRSESRLQQAHSYDELEGEL